MSLCPFQCSRNRHKWTESTHEPIRQPEMLLRVPHPHRVRAPRGVEVVDAFAPVVVVSGGWLTCHQEHTCSSSTLSSTARRNMQSSLAPSPAVQAWLAARAAHRTSDSMSWAAYGGGPKPRPENQSRRGNVGSGTGGIRNVDSVLDSGNSDEIVVVASVCLSW